VLPVGTLLRINQGKKVCPADTEYAPDGCADQPLQAHRSKFPFEQHNARPNQGAHSRILNSGQPEGLNEIACNRNYYDKKKTYEYQFHNMTSPGAVPLHICRNTPVPSPRRPRQE